jgi:hypothetical protein
MNPASRKLRGSFAAVTILDARNEGLKMRNEKAVSTGISFASAFALVISWAKWHSFWWALLHGILGWFYVAYYFLIAKYK